MALALPHLGPRTRKVLRIAGIVLLGLFTFAFALQWTFPYDRVKAKAIEALSAKYDVTIGKVEPGLIPGRVYFHNVILMSRPTKADETATVFAVKKLKVDLGFLPLIGGKVAIDIDAAIGPGNVTGTISFPFSGRSITYDLTGDGVPSAMLPMRDIVGVPTSGKVDFSVALTLPSEKLKNGKVGTNWQKAKGAVSFNCPSQCVFGDGKSRLKLKAQNARQQAFVEDGTEFGTIQIDSLLARVDIKDNRLELTKFDFKSPDVELDLELDVTLQPVLDDSMVAGCVRFKGSESLAKREPKTHAMLTTTGANIESDGLFHIRLDGKFGKMGKKAQPCGPLLKGGNGNGEDFSKTDHDRPNLTIQPPDDTLRGGSGTGTPVNPPPPPAPVEPPPPIPTAAPIPADTGAAGAGTNGNANGVETPAPIPPGATPPGEPVPGGDGTAGAGGADGAARDVDQPVDD